MTSPVEFNRQLKEVFFKSIEHDLALFNGPSIVKMAREATKEANAATDKYTLFFLGWILNPIREVLDPYASARFMEWPRFSHDLEMKITQRDLNDGREDSVKHAVSNRRITKNQVTDKYTHGVQANFIGCSLTMQIEVQITYEALVEVGLSGVDVYLYKQESNMLIHPNEIIKIRKGLKDGSITYHEAYAQDNMWRKYIGNDQTDEQGYVQFNEVCPVNDRGIRSNYFVLSAMEDPEEGVEKLFAAYDRMQALLATKFNRVWAENKPLWEHADFITKQQATALNTLIGMGKGVGNYFSIFGVEKVFKGIWNTIYSKGKLEERISSMEQTIIDKLNNDSFQDVLKNEGISAHARDVDFSEVYTNYSRITKFLADEAAVYFVLKEVILCIRMTCDKEIQALGHKMEGELIIALVIGTIVGVVAARFGLPKKVIIFILVHNLSNLASTGLVAFSTVKRLTRDLVMFEEIFTQHAKENEDLNARVRTHGVRHEINRRHIHQSDPLQGKGPTNHNHANIINK